MSNPLNSEKVILNLINEKATRQFVPGQLTFGTPTVITDGAFNTSLVVTPAVGQPYTGTQTIKYARLPLTDAPQGASNEFTLTDQTNTSEVLADLVDRYGVLIAAEDIIDEALPAADEFGTISFNLRANGASKLWTGQLALVLKPTSVALSSVIPAELEPLTITDVSTTQGA